MTKRSSLSYAADGMMAAGEATSEVALSAREIHHLGQARDQLIARRDSTSMGWLNLPREHGLVRQIKQVVSATKAFETLLVLGIGGSDLGARAIIQALQPDKQVIFAGANTDPDELASILARINWRKTCVNVISKSGDTVEPMSSFFIVRELLKRKVGRSFARQIVATTDPSQGSLHALAVQEGYRQLPVPANVGGRFSVLSPVGLFPAAWAGISIESMLSGAREEQTAFETLSPDQQLPAQYAALHVRLYQQGRHEFVFMPYVSRLAEFARWYRQLIAESLGKAVDRHGHIIHIGPTPIAALGATDQHSQLQLYMEGPANKVITFLELARFDHKLRLPKTVPMTNDLRFLSGKSLEDIIHAERKATAEALTQAKQPHGTITIDRLEPKTLGRLFQFWMLATAYLGELFDINAYDQPGVQEGKTCFHQWLKGEKVSSV